MTLGLIKAGTQIIAELGIGTIVTHAVNHVTPAGLNKVQKVLVWSGSVAIAGVVGEASTNFIERKFEALGSLVTKKVEKTEEDETEE